MAHVLLLRCQPEQFQKKLRHRIEAWSLMGNLIPVAVFYSGYRDGGWVLM
jgi:hypothetical protein